MTMLANSGCMNRAQLTVVLLETNSPLASAATVTMQGHAPHAPDFWHLEQLSNPKVRAWWG
jgi:hypothetical protein